MSCAHKLSVIVALAAVLFVRSPVMAQKPSAEDAVKQDLNNYAMIVAGYQVDGRCQILAASQRTEYASHTAIIRRAFVVLGLDDHALAEIAERARVAADNKAFQNCDAKTAETVERLGVLTQKMGVKLADWLADNDRTKKIQ
mgnify:FL=1